MTLIPKPCAHCHDAILPPEDVTCDTIAILFDRAGIDHAAPVENCLYAYGMSVPCWITIEEEAQSVVFSTYAEALPGVEEFAGLHFTNHCNSAYVLVQFSWTDPGRLWGHYNLPYADGLNSAQLMRCAHRFAAIFAKAVVEGVAADLLTYPGSDAALTTLLN